ncbi:S-layer homology domain-containing protein [Planococcus sp. ANT_H30]|uniref:S-layer homology domain-containing protein n=1 Tax=Planococcus sp. ANT_H30 TaxID=2597347 RepID=UPI00165E781E|nr:S-layer homology domain-containing protein [Planococcus sp. ANT_H30]
MKVHSSLLTKIAQSSALTMLVVAFAVSPVSAATFTDVSERYEPAVNYLVTQDITNGVSKTKFGIDQNVKRGDAAIILAHALGFTEKDAPSSGFGDVPTRGVVAINALKAAGIVNGKSAKSFGFNDLMKRGEMALMLTKSAAYNIKGDKSKLTFTDVNDRYADAVAALVDHKITTGKSAAKFGTNDLLKRGEYAVFIHKIEQSIEKEPVVPFALTKYQGLWETKRANSQDPYLSVNIENIKANTAKVQVDSMSSGAMYIGSVDSEAKFVDNKARIYYSEDGFNGSGVITIELLENAVGVTVVKSNERGYLFEGKYKAYKK